MAVQQRRNSKTRKAKRRTHYKLAAPTLVKCPACGEYNRRKSIKRSIRSFLFVSIKSRDRPNDSFPVCIDTRIV